MNPELKELFQIRYIGYARPSLQLFKMEAVIPSSPDEDEDFISHIALIMSSMVKSKDCIVGLSGWFLVSSQFNSSALIVLGSLKTDLNWFCNASAIRFGSFMSSVTLPCFSFSGPILLLRFANL